MQKRKFVIVSYMVIAHKSEKYCEPLKIQGWEGKHYVIQNELAQISEELRIKSQKKAETYPRL